MKGANSATRVQREVGKRKEIHSGDQYNKGASRYGKHLCQYRTLLVLALSPRDDNLA